jgi:drug/metabolite transporter (DMT)-like permease
MLGIGLKLASVTGFLVMATCLKAAPGIPVGEMVFSRSLFAIPPILIFLALRGELGTAWRTSYPLRHIVRGILGVLAMSLGFFALTRLPLPEATTLNYTVPLLLVALSAIVLKETVGPYRWGAVAVGMAGILIVVWPRLTLFTSGQGMSSGESLGVLAALGSACIAAGATLMVRRLVATEQSATIVLYFSITASLLGLVTAPFGWVLPDPGQAALLVGAGIAGGIAQIFLTESYRHGDMSMIAPFEYSSMILAIGVGYFVFAELPTFNMLIGGAVVVMAGIFIIIRESRLGIDRSAQRRANTP